MNMVSAHSVEDVCTGEARIAFAVFYGDAHMGEARMLPSGSAQAAASVILRGNQKS